MSNLVHENLEKFQYFFKSAHSKGVLDEKTKQLMHIALVIAMRCEPCAILSIEKGRRMGISDEELNETIQLAASVGAGTILAMGERAKTAADESHHWWKKEKICEIC